MMHPIDPILAKVREWAEVADEDLQVAHHTLTLGEDCPYRMVAYHAQQCAEKYLKAYLVWRGVDFPFSHNIARLRELCVPLAIWAEDLRQAEELSPYAISTRYPGESLIVIESDAREAVEIADRLRQIVRDSLQREGAAI